MNIKSAAISTGLSGKRWETLLPIYICRAQPRILSCEGQFKPLQILGGGACSPRKILKIRDVNILNFTVMPLNIDHLIIQIWDQTKPFHFSRL